jgi:pyruvate kinase
VRRAVDGALEDDVVSASSPSGFDAGRLALDHNTDALLGDRPHDRVTRIMVTLPTEAAHDPAFVRHLVMRGMDIARINGAHDDADSWQRMAAHVEVAARDVERPCKVSMDLAGPKLRTGPLAAGPEVLRFKPNRDLRGVPVAPADVTLVASPSLSPNARAGVPVDPAWLARRHTGDVIELRDTRGSARELAVFDTETGVVQAKVWNTTYIERGTVLRCDADETTVRAMEPLPQYHTVRKGDVVVVTRDLEPAIPWHSGQPGVPVIGCTLSTAVDAMRVGHRVVFDDGKISGVVEDVGPDQFVVRVLTAAPNGSRLRAEKGINLPDTDLPVSILNESDLPLIETAARCADMLALSFLRHEDDIDEVRQHLDAVNASDLGLVLKIETNGAFERLPEIFLRAMGSRRVGVMIARGDLAVEAGYGRLAEVQEEVLWLCEAARLPVIWATGVLDALARTGQPSRAEVTDAAMAQRAECVMLNKGPHIDIAIEALDEILQRMSGHQRKKAALLRPLRSWV